ncbi:hypothetical protein AURDEDRAFT_112836 [Auricularia subglabra TFB-10046 SS5]|nr:hypothetical protein AURDEDRAFT_112836 [Auricularia subglabra TFB-10046 SS5]
MRFLAPCLLAALLPVSSVVCHLDALHHDTTSERSRAHQSLTRGSLASNSTPPVSIGKRAFTNARATHYEAGLGACGKDNTGADFIVALNHVQFGSGYPGPNCFRKIRISYKGISAVAEIRDMCPGCGYGELDLTNGLFSHFVPLRTDIFYMSWEFIDGDSAPDPPKLTPKPTPKPTPASTKHSTSTHKASSRSSSSKLSSTRATATSTSTAIPTPTQLSGPQNVQALQQAMLGMARLASAPNTRS